MGILRFILAITVVIEHSSPIFGLSFMGGQIAVQAFFIISGFYMTLILREKYIGVNNSYRLFITNRLLRLYPVYWVLLMLVTAKSIVVALYSQGNSLGSFNVYRAYFDQMSWESLTFLITTNVFIFMQDLVLFLGLNTINGQLFFTTNYKLTNPLLFEFLFIPQAWSIGIELTFYLLAPLLVRNKLKIIVLMILISLLIRLVLISYGLNEDPWSYRFFPTELLFFLLGSLSYFIYVKISINEIKPVYSTFIWISLVGLSFFYEFIPFSQKSILYLIVFFISIPFVFQLSKKWKLDAYIGELSYPIYISHLFMLSCMEILNISNPLGVGLSLSILTTLFSILINEIIAKRIERIRQRRVSYPT